MKKFIFAANVLWIVAACQSPNEPIARMDSTSENENRSYEMGVSFRLKKSMDFTYSFVEPKKWLEDHAADTAHQNITFAINRTDRANFSRMDSVLVPSDFEQPLFNYLPFPLRVKSIADIDKIIYFSYPTQTFGVYQNGVLIRTGPTNMGKKEHRTPTGLFFTNWKAKVSTSTVNDAWILHWNVNIMNQEGVGWHQYSLPGSPVSHSCLRLQEADAKFLYFWIDQWVLANNAIQTKGTPVIIFGEYDFNSPKPWLQLAVNPSSLEISKDEIEAITEPFLVEIIAAQNEKARPELSVK